MIEKIELDDKKTQKTKIDYKGTKDKRVFEYKKTITWKRNVKIAILKKYGINQTIITTMIK